MSVKLSVRVALACLIVVCAAASDTTGERKLSDLRPYAAFGLDEGITPRLRQNSTYTEYFVDQFGPSAQPFGNRVKIHLGEVVLIRGWAVDAPATTLAGGVEIVIDGHAYKLPYFLTRGDVAAAKRREAYTDSGFLALVPRELMSEGSHTVSLRIIAADRRSYYQTPVFHVVVGK